VPAAGNLSLSWSAVLYSAPSGGVAYARFSFLVTNAGAARSVTLSAEAPGSGSATGGVKVEPGTLSLAAGSSGLAEARVPSSLAGIAVRVRVTAPGLTPLLIPLDSAAFPHAGAAAQEGGYDSGSQAALVIFGLLVAAGVGFWSRRRYRQSLLAQAAAAGSGYERVGEGEAASQPLAAQAAPPVGGVQQVLHAVKALPGRLRAPRRSRRPRGEASPGAVGLVLGAGTVVATPEEAVAGGARARQGATAASPEWDGAWGEGGEEDGWDLSDRSLLGSDEEAEQGRQAPQPQQAGAGAQAQTARASKAREGGSDSDWDA